MINRIVEYVAKDLGMREMMEETGLDYFQIRLLIENKIKIDDEINFKLQSVAELDWKKGQKILNLISAFRRAIYIVIMIATFDNPIFMAIITLLFAVFEWYERSVIYNSFEKLYNKIRGPRG